MVASSSNRELNKAISAADKAWDAGNIKWFNYLAPDAVVYSVGQTKPFIGRQAYEAHFGAQLTGAKRKTHVLTRNIQVLDRNAVVAQTLQIRQQGVAANVRQSVVWTNDQTAGWKIKHLHTALIGTPSAISAPRKATAVRVLNAKIATIAAMVGVAQ